MTNKKKTKQIKTMNCELFLGLSYRDPIKAGSNMNRNMKWNRSIK